MAEHPGNIFLEGEVARLPAANSVTGPRKVRDYEGREVAAVERVDGFLDLGRLPVGYYTVGLGENQDEAVSLGVLARLRAPTPERSPIALDVAMAWFYPPEKMDAVSSLCALAGVNWVRDRLNWGQVEKTRGTISDAGVYDASARAQAKAGLQVLQVNHISPRWANPDPQRFPPDLRDAYRFYRAMAERWAGQVLAFEPWNEADIPNFGGHTGSEMASLQKAAYLGLKAGRKDVIACLNVFALHNQPQLADLQENETWPYFDTFNLHHYEPVERYPAIYSDFRAVSAGRPLWVTECNVPVKWADEKTKEPSPDDLRVQAERVAKVLAASLFEGSVAGFYFLLPHYVEGQTQFGLLRPDLTPRPAYLALAAAGRFLAGAKPLGQLQSADRSVHAFLFQAQPDGQDGAVLVAWTGEQTTSLAELALAESVYDHLGRPCERRPLTRAPLFAVLPRQAVARFSLDRPPASPPVLGGQPWPIVLQALWPKEQVVLGKSAYRISSKKVEQIPVWIYNFGEVPAQGRLTIQGPSGWSLDLKQPERIRLAPQERLALALQVDCRNAVAQPLQTIRITGEFGSAGRPVLAFRLMPEP